MKTWLLLREKKRTLNLLLLLVDLLGMKRMPWWLWFLSQSWKVLLLVLIVGTLRDFDISEEFIKSIKKLELHDLSVQLQSFKKSQIVNGCIVSENNSLLPYPQDKIQKLFVRKCYEDVFELLLCEIERGTDSFAVSGTPGIGKSLFFVYILFRILQKQTGWKPKRIVYHTKTSFVCFDLENITVSKFEQINAEGFVREANTLYVIDGSYAIPLLSSCVTIFISSPRSRQYKDYVKQKMATEWFFPVWTFEELFECCKSCYQNLLETSFLERYRIYGGVARYVFYKDFAIAVPEKILHVLSDANAVRGVRYVGEPSDIFPESHTLMHMLIGNDTYGRPYKFIELDVASKYVGEQLWDRHYKQMITNLQDMFGGSPNEISRHLFEIYGHRIFSKGGKKLKCRDLQDGSTSVFDLERLHGNPITFGKDNLPQSPLISYYEASDDDNFPAIDSLSGQGMFQFTVANDHPIRGVQILKRLCCLYSDPKLFFVVPPHRFEKFKKQKLLGKQSNQTVVTIPGLKQYVLELEVGPSDQITLINP
jgi:hypothetical protein